MNISQAHNLSESFWLAHQRCIELRARPDGQFEMPIVPAIVCAVFSIEVGIKAIILSSGNKATGHDLEKLYKKLKTEHQAQIINDAGITSESFNEELKLLSNAFIDWRYVYEQDTIKINMDFLNKLAIAVQGVSLRARPSA